MLNGKRPDISIVSTRGNYLVDVSVVHSLADSHRGAARSDRHIQERERIKTTKYLELARRENATFIPVVLDTYGASGDGMKDLVEVAKRISADAPGFTPSGVATELRAVVSIQL